MAAAMEETKGPGPVLEVLKFSKAISNEFGDSDGARGPNEGSINQGLDAEENTSCLLCDLRFQQSGGKDKLLKHLLYQHHLVIGDVKLIADFHRYLDHWRERLHTNPLSAFCTIIQTNTGERDVAPKEVYFLLCDALPEDKELRIRLQRETLTLALSQQQREREDRSFSRKCLFCKEHFEENRAKLFDHMAYEHTFNVGQPNNLVYANEFLDLLEEKLRSLKCLYCEKTFKDRYVLKEHMRKKLHRKINPKNHEYDKFYIINYLEWGKDWEVIQSEDDSSIVHADSDDSNSQEDWADWREGSQTTPVCLFCAYSSSTIEETLAHMTAHHHFDLSAVRTELHLTFYQQVKLVNYIRRQVHQLRCPFCEAQFDERCKLEVHMATGEQDPTLPVLSTWDQPQYFFPTYEDDTLLCSLDDDDVDYDDTDSYGAASSSGGRKKTENIVIAEDRDLQDSLLSDWKELKQLVKH